MGWLSNRKLWYITVLQVSLRKRAVRRRLRIRRPCPCISLVLYFFCSSIHFSLVLNSGSGGVRLELLRCCTICCKSNSSVTLLVPCTSDSASKENTVRMGEPPTWSKVSPSQVSPGPSSVILKAFSTMSWTFGDVSPVWSLHMW